MSSRYKIQNIDIDLMPISIAVYEAKDNDFVFVDFNKHAEITDSITKEELLGRKVTEVFPGVIEFGLFDVFKRVHATKQHEKFELNFYKDEYREGWKVNDVIANDDGTIMAIYKDVTKEVHKEKKMHSMGALIDGSDNEYYIFEKDSLAFTYFNKSAEQNIGYTFEELSTMTPVDIKPDFSNEDFWDVLQPLLSKNKKQVVFEARHQRKDGSLYDVEARVQLMEVEGQEKFVATILDVTKRKILESGYETLGAIVNNSVNEVYIFEHDTLKFTYSNKSAQDNIGYSSEELAALTPVAIKPEYNEKEFVQLLQPLIDGSSDMVVFETYHERKDGTQYPVEARVQSMIISNKLSYVALVMDITSKKESERQFLEQQNVLMAQSKMASMGEMLGNIAHQWRQPLTVISTISSGIKLSIDLKTMEDEEVKENLDKVLKVTQHLSNTIDDFREFFKPDKSLEEFRLKDVYTKNMAIMGITLEKNEIEMITHFDEVEVVGYFNEMMQSILNIMNNAKDALLEDKRKRLIFIDIYEEGDYGVISIKDNAGGIPEDIIGNVFDPYFSTKHQSQGTGIGLYMTKQIIIKHMKGIIEVNNEVYEYKGEEYKGANFTLKIPRCK